MTKIARTVAALRAHKTRAEQSITKTRSRTVRTQLRGRIADYSKRIAAAMRRTGRKAARRAAA